MTSSPRASSPRRCGASEPSASISPCTGRAPTCATSSPGIEGQEIAEAGGIYKLLTGPRHSLSVSAGFAYTWEQRLIPPDLNFAGASAGFAYGWKISPTAEFTEEFNYLYDFEDSSDWRVNNAVSVSASITKVLALKLSHQLVYLNSPVPGKKSTDTTVLATLVAKF